MPKKGLREQIKKFVAIAVVAISGVLSVTITTDIIRSIESTSSGRGWAKREDPYTNKLFVNWWRSVPKDSQKLAKGMYNDLVIGKLNPKEWIYVQERLAEARRDLQFAEKTLDGDIGAAFMSVISANGEVDAAYYKLKGRPELQKYLEPARAAVLQMRKLINEERKLQREEMRYR